VLGIGLTKGGRFAVLAYNSLGWLEIYVAASKAGVIVVPINFRLVGLEVRFILENVGVKALIVQDELAGIVEEIRADLSIPERNHIHFGRASFRNHRQPEKRGP
jgi:acyl-CoA synthetase (AMP-forming)/AMP-acid ligase II